MPIYIAIGANINSPYGTPKETLRHLPETLKSYGIQVVKTSRLWENPAWPDPNDPVFFNGCLEIQTDLNPDELLSTLLEIEKKYGRRRSEKNAPRSLDLDIIDYRGQSIKTQKLTLPHPRLHERAFVLLPLFDVAPNWINLDGSDISKLIANLPAKDIQNTRPKCHENHPYKTGPNLMGILNTTPDSFYDGGQYNTPDIALKHALKMIDEGVNIIDIGGESTRPGAKPVSIEEEIKRTIPIISELSKYIKDTHIKISIDTRHAKTMAAAIEAGAHIINDVSALTHDPASLAVAAQTKAPVFLMHMQGTPETMQQNPTYNNVLDEIKDYLRNKIDVCLKAGITPDRIVVDPGIGFGKTQTQNLQILNNLDHFHSLGVPLLLGASRKSFIDKICSDTPSSLRLPGSLAAALKGLESQCQIFRVHDVAETKQAFEVFQAIQAA